MKVRVTFDITDADRKIIGLKRNGEFEDATREELVEEIEHAFDIHMHGPRETYEEVNDQIKRQILEGLGQA